MFFFFNVQTNTVCWWRATIRSTNIVYTHISSNSYSRTFNFIMCIVCLFVGWLFWCYFIYIKWYLNGNIIETIIHGKNEWVADAPEWNTSALSFDVMSSWVSAKNEIENISLVVLRLNTRTHQRVPLYIHRVRCAQRISNATLLLLSFFLSSFFCFVSFQPLIGVNWNADTPFDTLRIKNRSHKQRNWLDVYSICMYQV